MSANRRRAACDVGTWSNQSGSTLAISIIGDIGDARAEWTYHDVAGRENGGGSPTEPSAPAELDAADHALAERGYVYEPEERVALANDATIRVGAWTFRRARVQTHAVTPSKPDDGPASCCDWNEYEEHVEVRCGARWVPVPVDNVRYDEPEIEIWQLNDRVAVVELDADWGIEGERGGQRSALALDVAATCAGR